MARRISYASIGSRHSLNSDPLQYGFASVVASDIMRTQGRRVDWHIALRIDDVAGRSRVTARAPEKSQNYSVKRVKLVLKGSDVQARIFTLAPGDRIPWHYHRQSRDHFFVLEGILSVTTRNLGEKTQTIETGGAHSVAPGTAHLIANKGSVDCRFLLLQGVGPYDWIKAD